MQKGLGFKVFSDSGWQVLEFGCLGVTKLGLGALGPSCLAGVDWDLNFRFGGSGFWGSVFCCMGVLGGEIARDVVNYVVCVL